MTFNQYDRADNENKKFREDGDLTSVAHQDISYNSSTGSNTISNFTPEWSHNSKDSYSVSNVPNGTPHTVIIDMQGYKGISVHVEQAGGGDTFAVTLQSSNEGSGSTDDFIDTTSNGWTVATGGGLTADCIVHSNKGLRAKAHKVTITTAGGAGDADFNIFVYRW